MTVKEILNYFFSHGMSMSYIAKRVEVDPSTLTKWLKGQKGITHKNEEKIKNVLQEIAENFYNISR